MSAEAQPSIIGEDGTAHKLPTNVVEQPTAKTSVYRQGELIYDGATGQAVGSGGGAAPGAAGPGGSLNEMLKWGIENSSPEELARRAAQGEAYVPKQIDKEIMDMLLGEPIVAKMRECLGKLEPAELGDGSSDGLDAGAAALEELEYYAEDLDNAHDLVKIGGLHVLMRCCTYGLPASSADAAGIEPADATALMAAAAAADPDGCAALREAACGVLAAMLQNNPKVQTVAQAVGVATCLLSLLGGADEWRERWEERVGGLAVVRKALLALSALLRGEAESGAPEGDSGGGAGDGGSGGDGTPMLTRAMPTLCALAAHQDAKLRRRCLFLLASLAADADSARSVCFASAVAADSPLPRALATALGSDDEDTRTQATRFLDAARAAERKELGARVASAGGIDAAKHGVELAEAAAREGGDATEAQQLRRLVEWLATAAASA